MAGLCALYIIAYSAVLVLYRPAPESLKAKRIGYLANIYKVKVSLLLGIGICVVFALTSKLTFDVTDPKFLALLGLNNRFFASGLWCVQFITHNFVHENIYHLLTNLSGLGMASLYERRVGARRFLMVFMVSSICAAFSIFLYPDFALSVGISGGVFGFAAAYFTDHNNLSAKDWFMAIAAFIALAIALAVINSAKKAPVDIVLNIDHIGHAMAAMGAIIYCRLRPVR